MAANKISRIRAREIIDCRGWPTVQVDVYVDDVLAGRADVPQGRSTGKYEAHGHCQTKNLAIFQSPSGCWKSQVFCAVHRKPGITNST